MSVELATAYISLVPSTRGFAAETNKQIAPAMAKQGGQIGDGMLAGIGKSLKVGAVAVGALAVGGIGTALVKGFSRLGALDQATAKLSGLGHSAETVEGIMANALNSVKGTAFGMDEAASTAAGAVAAGIKPGADLERTLKAVADASTIAGTDMGSMGAIFNKVAASNKVQMDVINQLQDAGVPALALLADQMGVTAEEASKMASDGEIDFATFQAAMEEGMGGAAAKSGETFSGAMDNMGAALGRVGANLLSGIFPQMKDGLGGITDFLGPLEEKAKDAGAAFSVWAADVGPKVVDVLKSIGGFGGKAFAWIGDNIGLIKTIGGVVLGLAAAILVYRGVVALIALPMQIATAAQIAWNVAMSLSPIGIIIVAIIALVAAIIWVATQTTIFQDAWKVMVDIFTNSVGMFSDFFSNTGGMFADFFANTIGMFSDFIGNTLGMFADFGASVSAFFAPAIDGIAAIFTWLYDNVITPVIFGIMLYFGLWAALFTWIWTAIIAPIMAAIGAVFVWLYESAIKPALDFISAIWTKVWSAISAFFGAIWAGIVAFVTAYINTVMSIITAVGGAISSVWAKVWGGISSFFGAIWSGIVAFVTAYINTVRTIITTVVNVISGIWSNVWGGISSFFSGIWDGIVSAVQSFGGFFKSAFSGISGFVTNAFSGVLQAVKGPINGIIGIVNGAISALNGLSVAIPDWVPVVGGQSFGLSLPTIPKLAAGGIVSKRPGGIIANVGEGRYDEAVVPLTPAFLKSLDGSSDASGRPIYVQNPFTGEYLLAQVGQVAGSVMTAAGQSRDAQFRRG